MHDDETNELTAAERMMLAALPREAPVSDMLEERVVRALRRDGHLGATARRSGSLPVAWKVAAALALFAGGVATGRYLLEPDAPRAASAASATNEVRPATGGSSIQVNGTQPVVAQTEMWL
jgi:hypothetical protein